MTNPDWREQAACRGEDTALWFPPDRAAAVVSYRIARRICDSCPVKDECLTDAYANGEIYNGMYGGLTPNERQRNPDRQPRTAPYRLRRRSRARLDMATHGPPGRIVNHGTRSAYARGCGCDECFYARRDYDLERSANHHRKASQ